MLRRARSTFAVLILCLLTMTGCVSGAIYSHTTVPLDTDFDHTPAHNGERGDSWKTLVVPLIGLGGQVRFDWGDISIADSMRQAGIETIHYADVETLSVLGIWTQRWVHVYGE